MTHGWIVLWNFPVNFEANFSARKLVSVKFFSIEFFFYRNQKISKLPAVKIYFSDAPFSIWMCLKGSGAALVSEVFFQTMANWLVSNFSPEIIGRFLLKCHCMFANRILSENWKRLPSCKLKYQAISITVLIRCWGVSPDSSEIEGHKQKTKIKYLGQRENIIFKMVQNFW